MNSIITLTTTHNAGYIQETGPEITDRLVHPEDGQQQPAVFVYIDLPWMDTHNEKKMFTTGMPI
jgi:hypothetical protein